MGMGGSTREYSHRPENLDFPAWRLRAPSTGRLSGLIGAILLIAVVTAIMWITGCAGLTAGTAQSQTPTPTPSPTPSSPAVSGSSTTDAYGGILARPCPDLTKTDWNLQKVTVGGKSHWVFCTPSGYAFI